MVRRGRALQVEGMSIYHLDFETSSEADISFGAYRYASDPSTRILMFAVAQDDGEPLLWRFDEPYEEESLLAEAMLRRNLLIYGLGGIIIPFVGIKFIDVLINAAHLV